MSQWSVYDFSVQVDPKVTPKYHNVLKMGLDGKLEGHKK